VLAFHVLSHAAAVVKRLPLLPTCNAAAVIRLKSNKFMAIGAQAAAIRSLPPPPLPSSSCCLLLLLLLLPAGGAGE
jgi:hypothetical protein